VESNIGILVKLSVRSQTIHEWDNSLINGANRKLRRMGMVELE